MFSRKFKTYVSLILACITMIGSFGGACLVSAALPNVALSKPITAGIYNDLDTQKIFLNDGDESTGVYYCSPTDKRTTTDNPGGSVSDIHSAWYQIDLEQRYQIEYIVLKFSETATWSTNRNFKITVSNSVDFSDRTTNVLGEIGADNPCSMPYSVLGSGEFYRYVRLERVKGNYSEFGYEKYTELEVFADPETAIPSTFPSAEATNVALEKEVTAGNWSKDYPKQNINDGNPKTYVNEQGKLTDNKNNIASDYTKGENWYQIDLGNYYAIEAIRLFDDTKFWSSGYNISVRLSNDVNFSESEEVFSTTEYVSETFPIEIIGNRSYYRYIRIEKISGNMCLAYAFTEVEVYAVEDTKISNHITNVAVNKPILAGMWDEYCPKTNLNDGNYDTNVYPGTTRTDNQDNKVSTSGTAWYLIDLEQEYTVTGINLYRYRDDYAGHNFRILASKTPEFNNPAEYDVIADTGLDGALALPLKVTVPEKMYRYIKFEKINGTYTSFDYTELEVMGYLPSSPFEISDVEFLDSEFENGNRLYNPLKSDYAGVRVSVKNKTFSRLNAMIVVALYDKSGKLLQCNTYEKQLPVGGKHIFSTGVSTKLAEEGSELKAFLWNSRKHLVPITQTNKIEGQAKQNIYVSPNGNDSADGSLEHPFQTIERAKQEVKKYNRYMSDDIDVYLREGVYQLDEELVFDETDSGYNGYYVNYQGYPNETAVLSGGTKIENWTYDKNGIYYAKLSGITDVRELYANGRKQRRAQSENKIAPLGFYQENGVNMGYRLSSNVTMSEQPERIQLHFDRVFNTYVLNVTSMKKSGNEIIVKLQQPQFSVALTNGTGVTSKTEFYLENSLSELDTPGEFYYDIAAERLYYYPESDIAINEQEIYVPVLEKLLTVKGSTLENKVKNLSFSNLKFTHATCYETSQIGLMIRQAQEKFLADERGTSMVDSHITLSACENIVMKDNVFTGLAMVGVGIKNGAANNNLTGNVFYDIGDAAVTIGNSGDVYTDMPADSFNLAFGKKTYATSPVSSAAINGVANSGWHQELTHCSTCGGCSTTKCSCDQCDYTKGYWQIDLGQPEQIDRIEIDARIGLDQPTTRRNFEILGSNDPDFQEGVRVLGRCGPDIFPLDGTWRQNVMSSKKYRYVRVRKTVNEYFFLAEIRLLQYGKPYQKLREICKNNLISNNYITNVGDYNHSSPGIQGYFTEATVIRNNLVKNVPYTGIAMGWGWDNYPNATSARNNIIENNVVDTFNRMIIDGAGIYALGPQPGSIIRGNYIKNQVNECGAIYPDDGSRYWQIYDNVIENADMWMFIWNDNKKDINVYRNYTTTPTYLNAGVNCTISDTTYFVPGNLPTGAQTIVDRAGLEKQYESIIAKAEYGLTMPADKDCYANILNGGRDISRVRSYYVSTLITVAENILSIASPSEYPAQAFTNLQSAVKTAKNSLYSTNAKKLIELRKELQKAIQAFCDSKQ